MMIWKKEEMKYARIDDEREDDWRKVFENNEWGVYDNMSLLHAKTYDIYMNEKWSLMKGGYYM